MHEGLWKGVTPQEMSKGEGKQGEEGEEAKQGAISGKAPRRAASA